ncbi:MAG: class I SAM-dependent methyltransferase [Patescibacteria group bacterium]
MNKNIWEKDEYYAVIKDTHPVELSKNDPILLRFVKYFKKNNTKSILDVGCGEGWLLAQISDKLDECDSFVGIDVSKTGLEMAQKRNIKNGEFIEYNGNTFPFADKFFDTTVSSFVFEHLSNPLGIFNEMDRVTKSNGLICIACPNFGSPLLKSPCNKNNRLGLMITRFIKELKPKKYFKNNFRWDLVTPIELPLDVHISDYDTLCEPNLSSFVKFLSCNKNKYQVLEANSLWDAYNYQEISSNKNRYSLRAMFYGFVRFLGMKKFFRFQYFGSFFFVVIKKL